LQGRGIEPKNRAGLEIKITGDAMTDHHVHIGQFEEAYYDAREVFEAVFASGIVDRLLFSSTTSCVSDVAYRTIVDEIEAALRFFGPEKTAPLFWFIPDYIAQGVNVETAMRDLPYRGFKLHPFAQQWDVENKNHRAALHSIFAYAGRNNLPVLIHTGESGMDSPARFEPFFAAYPDARFILAHCRPADTVIAMFRAYRNVYGDSAFAPPERLRAVIDAGFAERIVPGTDFPITHYFKNRNLHANRTLSLQDQYTEDLVLLRTIPDKGEMIRRGNAKAVGTMCVHFTDPAVFA
jgi:predicted TIM-barrel fold metal-dependent hydrolase